MSGSHACRRKAVLGALLVALVLPAAALAAVVTVNGTGGDDTLRIQPESQDRGRLTLNGQPAGSVAAGDTLRLMMGPGSDQIFDEVEDFEANIVAELGAGPDRLPYVINANSDLLVNIRAHGGAGADELSVTSTAKSRSKGVTAELAGGPGNDRITVTLEFPGNSLRLIGGEGDDTFHVRGRGSITIRGGNGDDRINVRGEGRDRIRCDAGDDIVRADARDAVSPDCETVRRP